MHALITLVDLVTTVTVTGVYAAPGAQGSGAAAATRPRFCGAAEARRIAHPRQRPFSPRVVVRVQQPDVRRRPGPDLPGGAPALGPARRRQVHPAGAADYPSRVLPLAPLAPLVRFGDPARVGEHARRGRTPERGAAARQVRGRHARAPGAGAVRPGRPVRPGGQPRQPAGGGGAARHALAADGAGALPLAGRGSPRRQGGEHRLRVAAGGGGRGCAAA